MNYLTLNENVRLRRKALIIATCTAMSGYENGGSTRLDQIEKILVDLGFVIVKVCKKNAKTYLRESGDLDLVVISSYSCASLGHLARQRATFLWFDPYDSWIKSRLSLIKSGSVFQIVLLIRDAFFINKFPKTDLVTFVTKNDANTQRLFSKTRLTKILPIYPEIPRLSSQMTRRIIFVGDGKYKPNRMSLRFLNDIGKELNSEIFVVGKDYPEAKMLTHLVFLGYQDKSEIYRELDIHLVPIKRGAGIKTKAITPLMLGLPVIAFPEAASPFKDLPNLWTAKTSTDFAIIVDEISNENVSLGSNSDIYLVDESATVRNLLRSIKRSVS